MSKKLMHYNIDKIDKFGAPVHFAYLRDVLTTGSYQILNPIYIDEKGKLRIEQCSLAAYAHGSYFALGKKIGSFGYSVKKKQTKNRKK